MFGRKKNNFYRYMFQKSFMPLFAMLVVISMAFLIFFRITVVREKQKNRENDQRRLETCVSFTELQMKEIEKWGKQLLNGVELQKFVYMYDDLGRYSRFSLQNEIYESVYDLYYKNEQVDSVVLYIPTMGKVITDLHCQTSVKPWMEEMAEGKDRTCLLENNKAATCIHWDGDGARAVLIITWKDAGIMEQIEAMFLAGGDSIDFVWKPEKEPDEQMICADSIYYPFRMIYKESNDAEMNHFFAVIGLSSILFMCLCLTIAVISIQTWNRQIYRPLYRLLIEAFDHMEKNDFSYRIEVQNENDFFHSVYEKYNHMAETMQQYIETNLQQKILVSQSNLKQLQSQISPHFMYNSYYVLYRMIRRGDQENSLHLAEYLGSFYHYITRNADDEKHLSEEIEHAENYARIQKYRFRDNLHVEIAKPDECIADVYVPRLILQPILENAFKYAYESGNGDPMRLELGYEIRSDRDFDIIIENSGEISDETLQSLNEKLQSTDIQMPGMTGLQMVSRLREHFPDMRVLFLTGYDDFSFAYEAFRQHAVQYILKTEGDEVVLAAVKKEINRLRENEKIMERINDAEERYTQMLPAYRRQLIMQLMLNQKGKLDELEERMLAGELYLVVGLLRGDHNHHVKTKMITAGAVSQIVAGSFGKELAWSEYYLFDDVLIWVFDFDTKQSVSKTLFHLMRKARQQLEEQLKVTMFFIVSEEAVNGLDLNEKYVQIRTMLTNEILRGSTGVAIRHRADVEGKEVENAKKVSEMRRNLENIQLLVRKGSIAEAKNDINEVIAYLATHSQTENLLAVEAAQSLNAAILSYVNRNGMISLIVEAEHSGAMGTVAYFKKLQELLVKESEKRIDNAVKSVAESVVKYINSHISENVSTSVLSDVTGYSSGYLSRIFRQEIGMSIHDYVAQTRMNLAKEMLMNTNLKIYEVAENCGYENTTYFIKIFRINTGMTPQDYRMKAKH